MTNQKTEMKDYMLPCMNKKLFGVECMGCGTQRSIDLLLHGDFVGAFKMFPPIYTMMLFGIILLLHFFDKSRNYNRAIIFMAITNGIIMFVNYIYKIIY